MFGDVTAYFFPLDPRTIPFFNGMYWKTKIFYWSKNLYVLKLHLKYISFKAKSKPDMNFS